MRFGTLCGLRTITAVFLLSVAMESQGKEISNKKFTVGLEITAVSTVDNEKYELPLSSTYIDVIAKLFSERIGGQFQSHHHFASVRLQNGDEWIFHNDEGALEISTPVFKANEVRQRLAPLFRTLEEVGLVTEVGIAGQYLGGGHVHFGRQVFDDNPALLRNVSVDKQNKPYIDAFFEEMGDDQALSPRDRGEMSEFKTGLTSLDNKFRNRKPVSLNDFYNFLPHSKFSSINLANIPLNDPPTIEFRAFRAPRDETQADLRVRFMDAYIEKKSREATLIPLRELSQNELLYMESPAGAWAYMEKEFRELGLNPEDYKGEWETRFPVISARKSLQGSVEIRPGRQSGEFTFLEVALNSTNGTTAVLKHAGKIYQPILVTKGKQKYFLYKIPGLINDDESKISCSVFDTEGRKLESLSKEETIVWRPNQSGPQVSSRIISELLGSVELDKQLLGIVLCNDFEKYPRAAELLDRIIAENESPEVISIICKNILSRPYSAKHPRAVRWVETMMTRARKFDSVALRSQRLGISNKPLPRLMAIFVKFVLGQKHWAQHPKAVHWLGDVLADESNVNAVVEYLFAKDYWIRHPELESVLNSAKILSEVREILRAEVTERQSSKPEGCTLGPALRGLL